MKLWASDVHIINDSVAKTMLVLQFVLEYTERLKAAKTEV